MAMAGLEPYELELFALVLGDSPTSMHEISITATASDSVSELKELVYKKQNRLKGVDAVNPVLWKLNNPIPRDEADAGVGILRQNLSKLATEMQPTKKLAFYFPTAPKRKHLHIIVEPPSLPQIGLKRGLSEQASDVLRLFAKRPRRQKQDITDQLVRKWLRPLPEQALNLSNLNVYLQQPLAEDEKVPISQETFDTLSEDTSSPERAVSAEQLATLFRVSEDERTSRLEGRFVAAIALAPPENGSNNLFHGAWDRNISEILRFILPDGKSVRNDTNTSPALKWPDYGFLIKNHCVVRGEEKGSGPAGYPERDLLDKLIWTYQPLPYIIGYHATTTNVHFVAITQPPSTTEPLFHHNLKFGKERVANLVHLIRLSGVAAWLGQQLDVRNIPEFRTFELGGDFSNREGGFVRMSIGAVVRKEFTHPDAVDRVSKLIEIYGLLKVKQVPNVDTLDRAQTVTVQGFPPYVELSPVGYDVLPYSGSEALNAVVCVLQALKVMHSGPNPVYHRDIRGPNIIKRFDGSGWFLIDWSDASTTPTRAVTHLTTSEHSPRVRHNDHGAEVDIWGIGRYLEDLAYRVTCRIAKPDEVKQMARRWMADLTTSAEAALDEINANRDLFVAPAA